MNHSSLLLHTGQYSGEIAQLKRIDGLLAGTTFYTRNNFNPEFHYHENPHLSLILQGGNVDSTKKRSVERKVGDILFYHSGELHRTLPAASFSKNINLEIERVFLERYGISEEQLAGLAVPAPDHKFLVLKIYKELSLNDGLTDTSIRLLFLGLLAKSAEPDFSKTPPWLHTLTELLNDRWDDNPDLASLSEAVGVHPVTVSKYFTRYLGCTLGEYMRKLKVDRSLGLVRDPGRSLTDVALACGFADQSHFIRNFKAYTGLLPKEFRRL